LELLSQKKKADDKTFEELKPNSSFTQADIIAYNTNILEKDHKPTALIAKEMNNSHSVYSVHTSQQPGMPVIVSTSLDDANVDPVVAAMSEVKKEEDKAKKYE
jgi:hypothetical protein